MLRVECDVIHDQSSSSSSTPIFPADNDPSLPVPPWWFGVWLGDGGHDRLEITTVDDDIVEKVKETVRLINKRGVPAGSSPLLPVSYVRISSGNPNSASSEWWNPVLDGLKELGVYGNDKVNGIPAIFQGPKAKKWVRLALLGGMVDTDGCLVNNRTGYSITQGAKHLPMLQHYHSLALSVGITPGKIERFKARNPSDPDGPGSIAYRFMMSGKGLEELQPYVMPRKRRRAAVRYHETQHKPFRVDALSSSTKAYGRTIHVLGRDDGVVQLADGWLVRVNAGQPH